MNNSLLVRGFQRLDDLLGDGSGFVERNRFVGETIRERRALGQFHDQRHGPIRIFQPVGCDRTADLRRI
jgi:hypothetical protein